MAITTAKQAANMLNTTLSRLGYQYQIDTTSGETIEAGFKTVGAFSPEMHNTILNLQMKILRDKAYTSMFTESKNPMRAFWKDAVDYGGGVQEIFLKIIETDDGYWSDDYEGLDEAGREAKSDEILRDLVEYKENDIINKIHVVNKRFRVKMSISDLEYAKVFTPAGYASFIDAKYANFQQSAEARLMIIGIDIIKGMISDGKVKVAEGYDLNTTDGVTTFVEALNTVSDGMQTLTAQYNYDEVLTTAREEDLFLVTTPNVYNRMKSRGYANAFNLEQYKNNNRLILLPAGTDLGMSANGKKIGAILLDRHAVTIAIRYWEVQPFIVSNTDYRNTFLKVQLITGYTEFFSAYAFETGEIGNFNEPAKTAGIVLFKNQIPSVRVNGKDVVVTSFNGSDGAVAVNVGDFVEIDGVDQLNWFIDKELSGNVDDGQIRFIAGRVNYIEAP